MEASCNSNIHTAQVATFLQFVSRFFLDHGHKKRKLFLLTMFSQNKKEYTQKSIPGLYDSPLDFQRR